MRENNYAQFLMQNLNCPAVLPEKVKTRSMQRQFLSRIVLQQFIEFKSKRKDNLGLFLDFQIFISVFKS